MANTSKLWQPWLAEQSTETVDDLVPDDQSLHSKVLQTIDKKNSNFKNKKQKDIPYWLLKTECLGNGIHMETKPFSSLHKNMETGRSVCQDTRCQQSTSCRNYYGIMVNEENYKVKTVDNQVLETCSSQRSMPGMSNEATRTEQDPCCLTIYEMDRNKDLLKEINAKSDIVEHALNETRTIRIQNGSSNCIKLTQSTDEYSNYLKFPNKERLFRYEFRDKTDIGKHNLEVQMARHSIKQPLKCDVSFKLQKNRNNGNCKFNAVANRCDIWDKTFVRRDDLIEHVRTRTDNPHQCMICNKTFTIKGNLKVHMKIHTGEKPHQCAVCYKKFAQRHHLKEHMRTHTGEKPHQCTVCYKKFALKYHLNEHMRTHTGEKPHLCTSCDKTFAKRDTFNKHIRTHTSEKPHQCTICCKKFVQRYPLKVHMRTHTGEKPH